MPVSVKTKAKPKKKWTKLRHKIITEVARWVLVPYIWLRYGIRVEKFRDTKRRNYLVLLNHQTPFDQFFVGMAFRQPLYYMATEDIFSMGWLSQLLRWAIAPIPIKKQTTDINAVMHCIKIAREGGSIAIAPEGNRTYSGKTEYMNPAIAPLAKKLGLPILLFRIEGGYGAEPRWSDVVRKGPMRGYVARVIEPEEAATMSNDALCNAIREGLDVNEVCATSQYRHKKAAEYLERAIYICPDCGITHFRSQGDSLQCTSCGKTARYLPTKELEGDFPFRFVNDWYEYQRDYVNHLDTLAYRDTPICTDRADLYRVIPYKHKEPVKAGVSLALYGDRLVIDDQVMALQDISTIAVLGRNKLNIYHKDDLFQIKGDKRFNALKYVQLFWRSKNLSKGTPEETFLGL